MQNILSQNHLIAIYLFNFVTRTPNKYYFSQENHTLLSLIGLYYAAKNSTILQKDV